MSTRPGGAGEGWRERSDVAAAVLYAEHAGCLLRYCRTLLGNDQEAEDALQTTFLHAMRALSRGTRPECDIA